MADVIQPQACKCPLELSKGVKVHSLGTIEYINPKFHDQEAIYPVGFHVRPQLCLCQGPYLLCWPGRVCLANY